MPTPATISDEQWRELTEQALAVRENAYAPFSGFRVGSALLAEDGRVFVGANVENSSYGLTICAERSAACAAVSAGADRFNAIVIATSSGAGPCGACRQFLFEFGGGLLIRPVNAAGQPGRTFTLEELLPHGFRLRDEPA